MDGVTDLSPSGCSRGQSFLYQAIHDSMCMSPYLLPSQQGDSSIN